MATAFHRRAWAQLWHKRWRWPRRFGLCLLGLVCGWHATVRLGEFPNAYLAKSEASSLILRDSTGSVLRQEVSQGGLRGNWVPLESISPHLVNATLASEDNGFRVHSGVDWTALARASWLNLSGGKVDYGGSTITMQLVRLAAQTERSLTGKLRQSVLAARLERKLSKNEILEQYLNRVYYGNGAWGAEQAAQLYFGKAASEISLGEASLLAVFPRGPSFYNPFKHRDRALERREHILGLMHKHGYIKATERDLALGTSIALEKNRPDFRAPHFAEFVKDRLPERFGVATEVETTLDAELQHRVETAVAAHVDGLRGRNFTQAAAVVLRNSDGAILAMVGSRDYHDRSASGAWSGVTARLRPGSTLKPFVYGAAMEAGDTPATMAYDIALPKDQHQFYTKDVKQHGFARYRESLAGSYNLSAVHALQRAGIPAVLGKLRTAGLWTLDKPDNEYDWGLAIGHAEVRLIDLTAAFSTFVRGGIAIQPRVIERALNTDGESFSEPTTTTERVFSEEITYLLYDILSDPDARKPMFGDRVPMNLGFKVALKTGTTKAYTDLWAIGATKEYTVGVWGGNFDGSPTHQIMSVQGATPLMRGIYTAIASRYGAPTEPPRPDAVISANVCPLSGKRLGPHCEHHKRELFVAGNMPEETCDWHQVVCSEPTIVLPKVLHSWARFYGELEERNCTVTDVEGPVRIVAPADGARFLLEPHRDPRFQKPPLAALPANENTEWFIDNVPAPQWVPTPGEHVVRVARGDASDEVRVVYE
ncbi:MAG: hypothetical protein GY811_29245 [Myxococcales bacterium]|nr:hypothetical protein [Myxococcales bacterium]